MSASSGTTSSTSVYTTPAFWERLWRTAGIQSVLCFIVAYIIYGHQPQVGASADALAAFYEGDRVRILIAAVLYGLAVLNLMWFATALRTTLADAGRDGWGAAATSSSAALGGLFLLLIAVVAALAYSIAGPGNHILTSGLNGKLDPPYCNPHCRQGQEPRSRRSTNRLSPASHRPQPQWGGTGPTAGRGQRRNHSFTR